MITITPKAFPALDHWDEVQESLSQKLKDSLKQDVSSSLAQVDPQDISIEGDLDSSISVEAVMPDVVKMSDIMQEHSVNEVVFRSLEFNYTAKLEDAISEVSGRHPEDQL